MKWLLTLLSTNWSQETEADARQTLEKRTKHKKNISRFKNIWLSYWHCLYDINCLRARSFSGVVLVHIHHQQILDFLLWFTFFSSVGEVVICHWPTSHQCDSDRSGQNRITHRFLTKKNCKLLVVSIIQTAWFRLCNNLLLKTMTRRKCVSREHYSHKMDLHNRI